MLTKIIGAEFEANCDCCGRALKVGVQLSGLGVLTQPRPKDLS